MTESKVQNQLYEIENIRISANGGTAYATLQPRLPFRLREVWFSPNLDKVDIQYVQIANVIQAKFSKKCCICMPANTITIYLENFESNDAIVKIHLRGEELISD